LAVARGDAPALALHVSAGIGMERTTAPPIRFLCPPEICLVEMRH
jgi:predicted MPP superfamily phosphohydrolase